MPGLSDIFGAGSIAEQIFVWGVLNQVVSALGNPYFEELTQLVNAKHPDLALSPADAAQLVVRHFMTTAAGQAEAAKSGIDADRFNHLVSIAGDAPAPEELATALRRGIIPADGPADGVSFGQGIREGRLADKYIPLIKALAVEWPTPTDALDALLEGQISQADGLALYEKFGGDPQYFQMLFDTRGSAPTPMEAITMANRGAIPWDGAGPTVTSFHQAFLEGPWRDKWEAAYRILAEYLPPPRTVTAMIHDGSLPADEAAKLLAKQGLTPDLVARYIASADHQVAAKERELTLTDILNLYTDHILPADEATKMIEALGYSAENAGRLMALRDLRTAMAQINAAVSRVRTLYVGRKITRDTAKTVLTELEVPPDQATRILQVWDIEEGVSIRQLTAAQITSAWEYQLITQDEAQTELEAIGYTPRDAWILLSDKNKGALPNRPPAGPNPLGPVP